MWNFELHHFLDIFIIFLLFFSFHRCLPSYLLLRSLLISAFLITPCYYHSNTSSQFHYHYLTLYLHCRWYKKSFNLELTTTHDMSGRITHPEEDSRKIEWIVDNMVREGLIFDSTYFLLFFLFVFLFIALFRFSLSHIVYHFLAH